MRWGKPSILSDYQKYKEYIIKNGAIPVFLPKENNFDLDDKSDWLIAEAVFKSLFT